MEELIIGSMHDVNAFFDSKGEFYPLGCFDRYFHDEYPVEIGACYPSQLEEERVSEMLSVTKNAAEALEIRLGPVKADLVLEKEGFKILEMAPRLHGPKGTLWLSAFAGGMSHLEMVLRNMLEGNTCSREWVKPKRASLYKALLPEPGLLKPIYGIEDALNLKGIEKILIMSEIGSLISEYRDSTAVPGYIFASGDNCEEANSCIREAEKLINVQDKEEER